MLSDDPRTLHLTNIPVGVSDHPVASQKASSQVTHVLDHHSIGVEEVIPVRVGLIRKEFSGDADANAVGEGVGVEVGVGVAVAAVEMTIAEGLKE